MSKNRIKALKIGEKEFKFVSKKKAGVAPERRRQSKHEAEKLAGEIFMNWRRAFISTPTRPEDIPSRVLSLREEINRQIRNAKVRAKYLAKIDSKVEQVYLLYGQKSDETGA